MFWIELVATIFGFLCVVLTIRRNIWCWPVGLVQVLLFIVIFYNAKLYSDLGLHVIYVFLQIFGWYCWTREPEQLDDLAKPTNDSATIPVTSLSGFELALWIGAAAAGTYSLGYVMDTRTDASVPYADAFTTVASLVAQYLLARKVLQSWLFWIVVDAVAIGIYLHKELIPTSVLYSAFLVLAIIGFFAWRHSIRTEQQEPGA